MHYFNCRHRHLEVVEVKIILIRHGETDENAAHCYLGHYDAVLNQHGRQQLCQFIDNLKETLNEKKISIYTSDLIRATESARIIGDFLKITPISHSALRELSFGDWECKTYEQILRESPEQLTNWIDDPFKIAPPKGETLVELGNRVDNWFNLTLSKHDHNETIVIVSHQGPIRWLLSKYHLGGSAKFWEVEGVNHGSGVIMELKGKTAEISQYIV
jgi:broad specificity phosphatase PhoE